MGSIVEVHALLSLSTRVYAIMLQYDRGIQPLIKHSINKRYHLSICAEMWINEAHCMHILHTSNHS